VSGQRHILALCIIVILFSGQAALAEPSRIIDAGEILKKIELGQPVDYDNVIVEGDLDLSGLDLPRATVKLVSNEKFWGATDYEVIFVVSPIIIDNSIIKGSINLKETAFQNTIDFSGTRFEGVVYLSSSKFNETADFREAEFNQTATFQNVQFNQIADFSGARFNQTADFSGAQFNKEFYYFSWESILHGTQTKVTNYITYNTAFTGAQFNQEADFSRTQFNQEVDFSEAQFNQTAYFSEAQFNQTAGFRNAQFNQTANFAAAQFNQTAYFLEAQFSRGVYFRYAQFNQDADFWGAQFNQTDFSEVQFNQIAHFSEVQFNQIAYFRSTQFNQIANFRSTQFNQTALFWGAKFKQDTYLEDASFLYVSFDNSQFSKEAFFQGAQIKGTLSLNRTKYDTLNIRWSSIHDLAYDDTAYHLLIQNFNKLGFTDDARECQYSYRCKHRQELFRQHKFDGWLFDLLAWRSYGYGLRPTWPLFWSCVSIFLGGLFFFLTGSVARSKESHSGKKPLALRRKEEKPEGKVSIYEALLLSATYFTSGASSIISATPTEFVPIGRGRYVVVILRLLGWIFFVLFLSSLTRTV